MNEAPYETVTKLQAAERQLRVAIRLFFEGRDLIAVHALATGALQLLSDLGKKHGLTNALDWGIDNLVRPEKQKEVRVS